MLYIIYYFLMGKSTHNDKELERLHVRLLHLEHFSHHQSSSILRWRETAILNKFSILRYQIWLSLCDATFNSDYNTMIANIAMFVV